MVQLGGYSVTLTTTHVMSSSCATSPQKLRTLAQRHRTRCPNRTFRVIGKGNRERMGYLSEHHRKSRGERLPTYLGSISTSRFSAADR